MRKYQFDIPEEEELILLDAIISNKYSFLLGLDTAATHTTIDSNILYLSGYEVKDHLGEVEIETSNGRIITHLVSLNQFECLGFVKKGFVVQVYDFLAHGITSNYQGLLGMDFLREFKFCIDISSGEIIEE